MTLGRCGAWLGGSWILTMYGIGSVVVSACQSPPLPANDAGSRENLVRDTRIVHEACDVKVATEKIDSNGDGIFEVSRVKKGNVLVCEAFDLNQDGAVDLWVYYDPSGSLRRRELTYDRSAQVSEIRHYRAGQLVEIDQSTSHFGSLDTWHFFKNGERARTERDANGDGKVDEWWDYPNPKKPDCPMMYQDQNNDGQPDKKAGVDLCAAGYVPPERKSSRPNSPKFERDQGGLPTEVDKREDDTPSAATPPSGGQAKPAVAAPDASKGGTNGSKK